MAIVKSIIERPIDERAASWNNLWKRTYRRTFYVICDEAAMGPGSVLASLGVRIGDIYDTGREKDEGAFLLNLEARSAGDADGKAWLCTAEYGPWDPAEFPQNPLDRQPELSWEFQQFQEPIFTDATTKGNPIVNTAGDYFDPPVLKDFTRPVLKLIRNEAVFDPALAYLYHDKVNSDVFWGAAPGIVKVQSITPQRVFNQDIGWYWPVTYEFCFNPKGWKTILLNQGFRELDASGNKVNIRDQNNVLITAPEFLDVAGKKLAANGKIVSLAFEIYESVEFSIFNFEQFYNDLVNYQTKRIQGFQQQGA